MNLDQMKLTYFAVFWGTCQKQEIVTVGSKGGGGKELETYFGSEPFARFDKKNNFSEPRMSYVTLLNWGVKMV